MGCKQWVDGVAEITGATGMGRGGIKALQLTEFSKLFVFPSFGNVWMSKFRNFLEKNGIFAGIVMF